MTPYARRTRGKARARHVKGVMNKGEEQFAAVLKQWQAEGKVKEWAYEKVTLTLAPKTTLTVDFTAVMHDDELVFFEVKGGRKDGKKHIEEDAWIKLKMAAAAFPYLRFVVTWVSSYYPRKYQEVGEHGETAWEEP